MEQHITHAFVMEQRIPHAFVMEQHITQSCVKEQHHPKAFVIGHHFQTSPLFLRVFFKSKVDMLKYEAKPPNLYLRILHSKFSCQDLV